MPQIYHSPVWIPSDDSLLRFFEFLPAYRRWDQLEDKPDVFPGMKMRFAVAGKKGVVSFTIATEWYTRPVVEWYQEWRAQNGSAGASWSFHLYQAIPVGLGYHTFTPQYLHHPAHSNCEFLKEATCYCDTSFREAKTVYWDFVDRGESMVWTALEARVNQTLQALAKIQKRAPSLVELLGMRPNGHKIRPTKRRHGSLRPGTITAVAMQVWGSNMGSPLRLSS